VTVGGSVSRRGLSGEKTLRGRERGGGGGGRRKGDGGDSREIQRDIQRGSREMQRQIEKKKKR